MIFQKKFKCTNVDGEYNKEKLEYVDIKKGSTFYVLNFTEDGEAIVQFWIPAEGLKSKYSKTIISEIEDSTNRMTFLIRKKDLENRTRRRNYIGVPAGTSITGGVTLLPFKIRPSITVEGQRMGFDFSKDIQIGLSGGIKQRIAKYNPFYLNLLLNIVISSVTMDEYNTRGTITENVDIAAVLYGGGIVLDFEKIQFGVFVGQDKVSDRNRSNWIYQGKTWWSVGFGYSILV